MLKSTLVPSGGKVIAWTHSQVTMDAGGLLEDYTHTV